MWYLLYNFTRVKIVQHVIYEMKRIFYANYIYDTGSNFQNQLDRSKAEKPILSD